MTRFHEVDAKSITRYHEVDAKSVTRIPGFCDPWFLGRYGMNLYRGCEHGCLYCDGRAERYHVAGDFARDIAVKRNAVQVLARELRRIREPGFMFLGGGVCDAYQPAEQRYQLARGALELALEHRLPVHVLTKSDLVRRDMDLLEQINEQSRVVLSFSIQTLDENVRQRFEPGAAPLERRWELLNEARKRGLGAGVMAMPVLPGISDQAEAIAALVAHAAGLKLDFVLFGGLTLRPGVQKDGYLATIQAHFPQHLDGYHRIYRDNRPSGSADKRYYDRINRRFSDALDRHDLPGRIPRRLFSGVIPRYTEAAILLEHAEFERLRAGRPPGSLRRAGQAIQRWARGRLAKKRGRSFDWRSLERELGDHVADGTILSWEGMTRAALTTVEEVLAGR